MYDLENFAKRGLGVNASAELKPASMIRSKTLPFRLNVSLSTSETGAVKNVGVSNLSKPG
ncbi:hypothetical protein [Chryseobacterium indoltheticum]|uniref:hypothetical protein n=1 Tax=Chryseobacterium indoltheticum TaxID=254 RepID=UPI003F498583